MMGIGAGIECSHNIIITYCSSIKSSCSINIACSTSSAVVSLWASCLNAALSESMVMNGASGVELRPRRAQAVWVKVSPESTVCLGALESTNVALFIRSLQTS